MANVLIAIAATIVVLTPLVLVIIGQRHVIDAERYEKELWKKTNGTTQPEPERDPTVQVIEAMGNAMAKVFHGEQHQQPDLPQEDPRDSDFIDRTEQYDPWMELLKDPDATKLMGVELPGVPTPTPQPETDDEMDR